MLPAMRLVVASIAVLALAYGCEDEGASTDGGTRSGQPPDADSDSGSGSASGSDAGAEDGGTPLPDEVQIAVAYDCMHSVQCQFQQGNGMQLPENPVEECVDA